MNKSLRVFQLFFLNVTNLLSQSSYPEIHRQITMKDGLPNPNIMCIFKDSKGNIWIGTWGNGLFRYDGYTFEEYRYNYGEIETDTNLYTGTVIIFCIVEDQDGILWIGSNNGLYECHPSESETISRRYIFSQTSVLENEVSVIYNDNKSNLWLGLKQMDRIAIFNKITGQIRYISLNQTSFPKPNFGDNCISSIITDHEGNL